MSAKNDQDTWIATAVLESHRSYDNDMRLEELALIVRDTLKHCSGPGLILFPGGQFKTGMNEAKTIYGWVEKELTKIIKSSGRDLAICVGIDGSIPGERLSPRDQIGLAITSEGIVARGRKFAPTKDEASVIRTAEDFLSTEDGLSRIFVFHGKRYYLAVCYDTCGISNSRHDNPGCDAILNYVHSFEPRGEGPSGDVQFARKVFSGASKRWNVPVYASVVFFRRNIPDTWPSGVLWNQDRHMSVSKWSYSHNPISPKKRLNVSIEEGKASVRVFHWE